MERFSLGSLAFLAREAPGFAVKGSQVKILTEPTQFYNELCRRAAASQKRIVLASLYLGTGEKEKQLVQSVRESLVRTRGQTRVTILLDFCRGNRMVKGENSCTMLKPLIDDFQSSCQVSLYHTPTLRGLWKKMPDRYNETIGIQHTKIYIFDDSLIISGANLSQDYFTSRQDRYVVVEDCPKLADYFEKLTQQISNFSFKAKLQKGENKFQYELSEKWNGGHPYLGKLDNFVQEANRSIKSFLTDQQIENSLRFEEDTFVKNDSGKIHGAASCDTWIFPTIQMGLFGINQDSEMTTKLMKSTPSGSSIRFGTGYFNLTQEYLHVIMHQSKANYELLMAHPKANGFLGARGPAGGIPAAYTLIGKMFYGLVSKNNLNDRIQMFEYQREGWTFHAKGIWHYLPGQSLPHVTLVGSPNYGYRSVEKDLESQLTIVTKNKALQEAMHTEQERLFKDSKLVTQETFEKPDRKIPTWVTWVVALARDFF